MVKEEVGIMVAWVRGLEATPTIVALRKKAEDIKKTELEKVFHRLGELSEKDRITIEGLASSIVNKLLHGPLVTLKAEAQSQNGFAFIEAARRFFELREREIHSIENQPLETEVGDEPSEESVSQKDVL
jgi:glutamyl-tRNA reductase